MRRDLFPAFFFLLTFAVGPAMAESGIPYHRLESCDAETGRALVIYPFGPGRSYEVEMTDLCFDRETGTLEASEPEEGLVLVRREGEGEFFEVLKPNTKPHQRSKAYAGRYEQEGPLKRGWVNFSFNHPKTGPDARRSRQHPDSDANLHGELFHRHGAPGAAQDGEFRIYVTGSDHREHEKRKYNTPRSGSETPYFAFEGTVTFSDGEGTAVLTNTETGNGAGEGEMTLSVDGEGEITGTGVFRLATARLAGANPQDWKTSEWRIVRLAGSVVGETGELLVIRAVARGETIDHDGTVNPVLGSLTVHGYSRRIMEMTETWK